jgi:hypothetical protein
MITTSPVNDSRARSKAVDADPSVIGRALPIAASGLDIAAPVIPMSMAVFVTMSGVLLCMAGGRTSEVTSVSVLHGTLAVAKKFMLKLKLGTRGILGMLGIVGILKLDLSCKESRIAFTREFTCSVCFSNRVSSPRDEALDSEW